MHPIEVACESVHVSQPEAAELREPVIDFTKRLGLQPIEAALSVDGGLDEAGVPQNAQVLGDGGLGHAKPALDFAYGLFRGDQQAEDRAAVRFGDDFEGGFHALYILQ